jgi:spore germination protein GerM
VTISRRAAALAIAGVTIASLVVLAVMLRRSSPAPAASTPPPAATPAAPERRINATLYYVSEDGMALVGVQREVPFGETVLQQAEQIVRAQLAPAPPPLVSAIPDGTALRAFYITERGDAFVDVSMDARTNHTGGALDELFTVYTIVDALTVNLPAITRVQILIEGREVDTLAGHVDLRNPLQKNLQWVRTEPSS